MQIAVLMSFVVICCFSRSAIIKKEKNFFMSVWGGAIPESERRELNKISRTIKSLFLFFLVFFTGVCGREDSSSLARQRRKLSRFIFGLNVYETTEMRIYEGSSVAPCWSKLEMLWWKPQKHLWNQTFSHQASWFSFWIWKLKWVFWLSHSAYLPIVSYQH